MKNCIKKCLLTAGIFLAAVLLGFTMICVIYALPSGRAAMHVRESGEVLTAEGDYWQLLPGKPTAVLDNFTDSIMLLTTAYDGEEGLFDRAVNNYRVYKKGATKQESCQVCGLVSGKEAKKASYARYWHGYMVVLKPLLTFLNLSQIRDLNMLVILGYLAVTCVLLYRRKKGRYIFPYLLSCCFLNPFTISASLQNSTIFHTASISVILLLLFYDHQRLKKHLWIFFMLVGMVTSYVDFLTYPVVSMAFPLIIAFILSEENSLRKNLGSLILHSGMWCAGYGGMWVSKWLLSSALTGKNYIAEGVETFTKRSGGMVGEESISLTDVCQRLNGYLEGNCFWYLALLFAAGCVFLALLTRKAWRRWPVSLMLLVIAVYPYIWAAGTRNHTYIHTMFTYRGLGVLIFGLSCGLLPMIEFGTGFFEDLGGGALIKKLRPKSRGNEKG